jgi:hypothetical protein
VLRDTIENGPRMPSGLALTPDAKECTSRRRSIWRGVGTALAQFGRRSHIFFCCVRSQPTISGLPLRSFRPFALGFVRLCAVGGLFAHCKQLHPEGVRGPERALGAAQNGGGGGVASSLRPFALSNKKGAPPERGGAK